MKTLILSCNAGAGHNSCALAIKEAYHAHGETCDIVDALQFISERASRFVSNWHTRIYRHAPKVFGAGYRRAEAHEDAFHEGTPLYKIISSGAERLYEYILDGEYDNIICTHVFPALALTEMRKRHDCPQLIMSYVSTDYTCSPSTADSSLDWYFIPSPLLADEFSGQGIPEEKLVASGMPVKEIFYRRIPLEEGKTALGIDPTHRHILMMCGSMGWGALEDSILYFRSLLSEEQELSVICGTNEDLYRRLQRITAQYPQIHVYGKVDNVPQLMQASDVFMTKPGGLSTSEAMAAGLPMVLIDAVAGCEAHNLDYFVSNGMAVTEDTPKAIADLTLKLLNEPELLSKMRAAMPQVSCTAPEAVYSWIRDHKEQRV